MKTLFVRGAAFLLVVGFVCSPVWATCGGGGGGGGGGMAGSGSNSGENPVVYHVPWKKPADAQKKPVTEGVILYWFPASNNEIKNSSLKESRELSLYASQCVAMHQADSSTPNGDALIGESPLPVAVLAKPDGTVISKLESTKGKLNVKDVEKLVSAEVKTRTAAIDAKMAEAKTKSAAGDKTAAIELYKAVAAEKCMFAKKAKDAAKELKKLGEENIGGIPTAEPVFEATKSALIVKTMKRGLVAENNAQYILARQLYTQARNMDPADPTPLRYLAELNRHHIGDWDKAKIEFNQILEIQADPLSRAVALHGLGKITIHEGKFDKGRELMEQSVETYPITLAYRNLAVYWNSEYEPVKGGYYTEQALATDPEDPYNLVFAAVFMAMAGKKDEALKVAQANMNLLPASYNLAAIYAQAGQRDKALALLKRHFYEFERFHAVRQKEMMEARVDAVFDSIREDKDFLALTKHADGMLPMPMSPRQAAEPMKMNH